VTKRGLQTTAMVLWGLLLAVCWPGSARAQAVTTSALSGRVLNEQQAPLPGAQVTATNTQTGSVSRVVTRSDGRYLLPGLQPGSYRVQVSGLGYTTQTRNLDLALGNTAQADFALGTQALAIEGITAVAERNAVISPTRTGAASTVSDSTLRRTPTITRDLQDFTRLVPQLATVNTTTGAVSAGGRNNRFNQLQIDGTASNDLFGLSASGSPGGQAGAKTITLEAVQELQVVIAPFDVRQNGFTGASINAVTRSGTNRFQGSISGFTRNENLAGRYVTAADTFSSDLVDFQNTELAGSFGGPIVRDRAFFFVAGETTRRRDPTNYVADLDSLSGISASQAERVAARLTALGYDPGTVGDRDVERESLNLFGRLDFNLGQNHRLTLRHNYVDGFRDNFSRSAGSFQLGNGGYRQNNTTNSSVVQLNSGFGSGIFNELRIGYNRVRDHRDYEGGDFPRVDVRFGSRSVIGGSENNSVANILDQDALEITNDLTIPAGAHTFTVGTSNEWAEFSNLFAANIFGNYRFDSYADFLAGKASQYDFRYLIPDIDPATPGDQPGNDRAEFKYRRNSFYVQDRWEASDNLQFTAGIRFERQAFPEEPLQNPLVAQFYQRNTSDVPEARTLINPRIGFNWDVTGDQRTQLRGGFGLFSGRAPFVWISNAYGNTGLEYVSFRCTGNATPAFVADPASQPRNCAGATTPAPNNINLVDPDLKLPQVSRWSLAVDRQLPLGLIGTVEGLYTKTINDLLYRNLRIEPVANGIAEGGRQLYRNRDATTTPGIGDVIDVTNTDEGYTYSLTGQVQRPFRGGWDFSLAYTFSKAVDTAPLNNSTAFSNWSFNLTDDDPNNPDLTRSDNDIPHRIVATTSRRFEFFRNLSTDLSLVYVGQSGNPYSYRYGSDVNGDGSTGNDLIFVPADPTQIRFQETATGLTAAQSWRNLDNFIESVECLRESRGEIIERNACRAPWSNRFDFRLAQNLSPFGRSNAQLTVDILNVGNLLNSEWGRNDFVNNQADNLLTLVTGTNNPDAQGRRLYQSFLPRGDRFSTSNLDSRYQIQLGVRYSF
jgi:outer membrane receptor for ferrienterochelin and colicin